MQRWDRRKYAVSENQSRWFAELVGDGEEERCNQELLRSNTKE